MLVHARHHYRRPTRRRHFSAESAATHAKFDSQYDKLRAPSMFHLAAARQALEVNYFFAI